MQQAADELVQRLLCDVGVPGPPRQDLREVHGHLTHHLSAGAARRLEQTGARAADLRGLIRQARTHSTCRRRGPSAQPERQLARRRPGELRVTREPRRRAVVRGLVDPSAFRRLAGDTKLLGHPGRVSHGDIPGRRDVRVRVRPAAGDAVGTTSVRRLLRRHALQRGGTEQLVAGKQHRAVRREARGGDVRCRRFADKPKAAAGRVLRDVEEGCGVGADDITAIAADEAVPRHGVDSDSDSEAELLLIRRVAAGHLWVANVVDTELKKKRT